MIEKEKRKYEKPEITRVEFDPEVSAAKGCKKRRSTVGSRNEIEGCVSPNQCKEVGS